MAWTWPGPQPKRLASIREMVMISSATGSIITSINGVQGAGVGISTGAGRAAVTTLNGSRVAGSIDLGAGDDTSTLRAPQ